MSKHGNPQGEWWLIEVVKNIMRCKFGAATPKYLVFLQWCVARNLATGALTNKRNGLAGDGEVSQIFMTSVSMHGTLPQLRRLCSSCPFSDTNTINNLRVRHFEGQDNVLTLEAL